MVTDMTLQAAVQVAVAHVGTVLQVHNTTSTAAAAGVVYFRVQVALVALVLSVVLTKVVHPAVAQVTQVVVQG
jgi:hypothetical protein